MTALLPAAPPHHAQPRELRNYQVEAADAVAEGWRRGVDGPAVVLPTGSGKPLHDDTPIPVPGGNFVKMGQLRVGDWVIGSDGKPTHVVAVEPQGVIPLYRLMFDDGSEVLAGAGHLWTAQRNGRAPRTVTTEWLAALSEKALSGWTVPARKPRSKTVSRRIEVIVSAAPGPATCIQVSNADGLFACTDNYILTHNSTVIAELARREVATGGRVLLMAHRNELVEQMADAVVAVNPTGPVPEMIGGPHRGDASAQIVSATVQSLQRTSSLAQLGHRDLLVIDEAHHAVARTYLNVIDHFRGMGTRRAGFTATMTRLAPKENEPPLRSVWGEVVYERDINWAIEHGFLLPPYGLTVELPDLDVDGLHVGAGDITDDEAEAAMMRETTLNATVAAVVDHTSGLSTIVFGASMDHCHQLAESLVALGVTAEVVVGPTTSRERRGIYRRFHNGQTRVLVTVDVLTEGADFPRCEAVVLARPTRSQARLVQCVGRGLRPHTFDGGRVKERALVVDLVGAGSLGLIVQTVLEPTRREISSSAGTEECPLCEQQPCICSAGGGGAIETGPEVPCTCSCTGAFGICRCACACDTHRVDPLHDFDPITGTPSFLPRRRGDSAWSVRTATIRWARHPRGLVRPVYRQSGSKGVLILADLRGVAGTSAPKEWAFGFFDSTVDRMFWVDTAGGWREPGPDCFLQTMTLQDADQLAQRIFAGHMRDSGRDSASPAQIRYATRLGVPDAAGLDRRDLSDFLAVAQADRWIPTYTRSTGDSETAA